MNPSPLSAVGGRIALHDLLRIAEWEHCIPWEPFREGVTIHRLYGDGLSGPSAALLRFEPGASVALHEHTGYEHILVLSGMQCDDCGISEAGTLLLHAPGTQHRIFSEKGCIVLAIYEKPVRFLPGE